MGGNKGKQTLADFVYFIGNILILKKKREIVNYYVRVTEKTINFSKTVKDISIQFFLPKSAINFTQDIFLLIFKKKIKILGLVPS